MKNKNVLLIAALLIPIIVSGYFQFGKMNHVEKLKNILKSKPYVAHALGGLDGFEYLNVIEALDYHYAHGCRVFEVDLEYTKDEKLVLSHGHWKEKDYKRLGIPYDPEKSSPMYDEFMSWKIQGKYNAADYLDLVEAMHKYDDIYVLLDLGNVSYKETLKFYKDIVSLAQNDASVLKRFIAGCQTVDMLKAVKEVYDFDLPLLYIHTEAKRKGTEFENIENYVSYCKGNGVRIYSIADASFTDELSKILRKTDLIGIVFTVNDEQRCKEIMKLGASVGTDFLCGD